MKEEKEYTCYVCGAIFLATLTKGKPDKPMCLSCVVAEIKCHEGGVK